MKKGTYVGLRILSPSNANLKEHCLAAKIKIDKSKFDRRLHTTVIYSHKHCPNLVVDPTIVHEAKFDGYDLFNDRAGNATVLVVRLDCQSIVDRHERLMKEYGAIYDYPGYHPHISLTYHFHGDVKSLPPVNFTILLGQEYTEDLDLNWKP